MDINNGLIIQWLYYTHNNTQTLQTCYFPIGFTNAYPHIQRTNKEDSASDGATNYYFEAFNSRTKTYVKIQGTKNNRIAGWCILAIGY